MKISAVLLAGGKSTRMGRDKADIEIDGEKLWQRQVRILRELSPDELFISGPPRVEWSGLAVVSDAQPGAGPLGGLVASLRHCAHPMLVVLAVDLPRMTSGFLRSLIESCGDSSGVVAKAGDFYEPLAAVYPKACLAIAEDCLASGELAMQRFVARALGAKLLRERVLRDDEKRLFSNVNTPQEWSRLSER
jgi:molybdenum cofactor guanylyltransferase